MHECPELMRTPHSLRQSISLIALNLFQTEAEGPALCYLGSHIQNPLSAHIPPYTVGPCSGLFAGFPKALFRLHSPMMVKP